MNSKNLTLFFLPLLFTFVIAAVPSNLYSQAIYSKYATVAATSTAPTSFPHTTNADGTWAYRAADWWASSFYSGTLYLLNARASRCPPTVSHDWLNLARNWSKKIAPLVQGNSVGHDQGFLSYPFVEELRLNPNNQTAKNEVNGFAKLLANRYSSIVGCTKSWDTSNPQDFEVIMDNMMNSELLFVSAGLTGNQTLRAMAMSHADKTIANHIRADGSSYHVVNYNANTGAVTSKFTSQGYANNSTWTRGQAWDLNLFKVYNYTQEARYINTARKMANLYLSRLPSSGVPPWDFDAPASTNPPRDTSAATIAATGMLLLSYAEKSLSNSTGADYWTQKAIKQLTDTINFSWQPSWQAILSNGTSNLPAGSSNTGLVYGDYYFVKAGNMLLDLGLASCASSVDSADGELESRAIHEDEIVPRAVEVRAQAFGHRHKSAVRHRQPNKLVASLSELAQQS